MAKQTFTTGQVLTSAQMTDLQQTAMTGGAASTKTVSYVLVAADAGTRVAMNAAGSTTITVNTALFSAGDTVSIQNIGAGVCTVTAGTATVNTSGSLVLAQYQGGILYFTSASAAIFFQFATPASGDIEGVTAGTGISGGGTSGTVTITNSMATEIDAKGDLVVGTGADTFARLAVGTNGHTLVAKSSEATGLAWEAPASGGMTQLASGSLSGTTTTISSISGSYNNLQLWVRDFIGGNTNGGFYVQLRVNGDTGSNYQGVGIQTGGTVFTDATTSFGLNGDDIARNQDRNASFIVNFFDYANTSSNKNIETNLAAYKDTAFYTSFYKGQYRPTTAAAINSISIICSDAAGWTQGTYVLYGVK